MPVRNFFVYAVRMSTLGIIGGSGLYAMEELKILERKTVDTPLGQPSDAVLCGELAGKNVLFLPRHGVGHRIAPHQINYKANILALKQLGATHLLSVSAVGSMREQIEPGDMVVVDQFIDRTRSRPSTFFEDIGAVGHIEFAEPVDEALRQSLLEATQRAGARHHDRGTYVCIEGPQFSTRAESLLYRSWGVDVIGMTNLPEARLAREAQLPYATLALATDYDCWHQSEESVTVEAVIAVIKKNVATAQKIVRELVSADLPPRERSPASRALAHAVMTAPEHIDDRARAVLDLLKS